MSTAPITPLVPVEGFDDGVFEGADYDSFDMGSGPLVNGTFPPTPEEVEAHDHMFAAMVFGCVSVVVLIMLAVFLSSFKRVTGHWNLFKRGNWRRRAPLQTTQFNAEPVAFAQADGLERRLMEGQSIQMDKEEKVAHEAQPEFREAQADADLPQYCGNLTLPPSYHRRASQEKRYSGGGWMRADGAMPSHVLGEEPISHKTPLPTTSSVV